MQFKTLTLGALLAIGLLTTATAQTVDVKNAWVRSSVQGQKATGAFMTLTAQDGAKLVGASSPAAGLVELHEMKMDGDIMRMREVAGGLELPAGKAVDLKPGGYHIMFLDLKAALPANSTVPLTLVFKDAKGVESKMDLKVPVALSAGAMAPAKGMDHGVHSH